jgi:hypothetical protein
MNRFSAPRQKSTRRAIDQSRHSSYSELKKQFERQQVDRRWIKEGGEIYYAVDTSVIMVMIKLFDGNDPLQGIFIEDSETRSGVCALLAKYLNRFKETTEKPLILIEPVDRELSGALNKIFSEAKEEESVVNDVDQKFKQGEYPSDRSLYDAISTILLSKNLVRGPLVETYRAKAMFESNLLIRLDAYLEDGISPFHLDTFQNKPLFREKFSFALERLNHVRPVTKFRNKSSGKPASNNESNNSVDAQVLAKLELLNLSWQAAGTKKKIVLITLDQAVEKTAQSITISSGVSLADLAIRSPISFIEDAKFFHIAGVPAPSFIGSDNDEDNTPPRLLKSRTRFSDWIEVYFGESDAGRILSSRSSVKNGEKLPGVDAAWQSYIKTTRSLSSAQESWLNQRIIDEYTKISNQTPDEASALYTEFKNNLDVAGKTAADHWALESVIAGFWALDLNRTRPLRAIPPIKSYTFKELTSLSKKLIDQTQSKTLQNERDDIFEKLEREDPTKYTTLIWLALVFCAADEWENAYSVAKGAYNLAKARSTPGENPKGDEAAYLCAVFNCLTAKNTKDFEASESWLRQAEKLQKEAPCKLEADGIDIRFQSERHTLELAKIFGDFAEHGVSPQFTEQNIFARRCHSLLALSKEAENTDEHVRSYVTRQCLVNAMQWSLIPHAGDKTELLTVAKQAFDELQKLPPTNGSLELTNGLTATLLAFVGLRQEQVNGEITNEQFSLKLETCKQTAEHDKRTKIFYHAARLELFVKSLQTQSI